MSEARAEAASLAPIGAQIEVEIGELVLHGFPPASRDALGDALGAELAASLAGWRAPRLAAVADLDGGTIRVAPDASPASVGRWVAHAVRQALPSAPASPSSPSSPSSSAGRR